MVERLSFEVLTDRAAIETGTRFAPRFDADGLVPCIVTDAHAGGVLMFAWMNDEALSATIETGIAHYWSRSRNALWKKGETSGNFQAVAEILTDCDQDAVWLKVHTAGLGANCHVGYRSCFFRKVEAVRPDGSVALSFVEEAPLFDPAKVYGPKGGEHDGGS